MRRIQEIIAFVRNDDGWHRQDRRRATLYPIRSDLLCLFVHNRLAPVRGQIGFFDLVNCNAPRNSNPNDNHVCWKTGAMREYLQSAQGRRGSAINQRSTLEVPAACGASGAIAIICRILRPTNPVDRQLPDTVFHLRENIEHSRNALMRGKKGNRGRIVQCGNGRSEPSKRGTLIAQNFCGPCDCTGNFVRVSLSFGHQFGKQRFPRGHVCTPEPARPTNPSPTSHLRHQFHSTSACSPMWGLFRRFA
jgi:hypothetical protein